MGAKPGILYGCMQVNKTVKPRTSATTSIPGLLNSFHNEWDAVMLELHTVRQQLHQTRQELSHMLYQHDAAVRVIARTMRERDEARSQLENAKQQVRGQSYKLIYCMSLVCLLCVYACIM